MWKVEDLPLGESSRRVWIGLPCRPAHDDLETLVTTVVERVSAATRCVLHIQHVESDALDPPDLPCLLQIVGALMQHRDLLDRKVAATCIQAKHVDDAARMTVDLFLGMWQTDTLVLVDTQEETDRFLRKAAKRVDRERIKDS